MSTGPKVVTTQAEWDAAVKDGAKYNENTAWLKGYDQAIQEVLDEVHERSPAMASDIMNKYPEWKALVQARRAQRTF